MFLLFLKCILFFVNLHPASSASLSQAAIHLLQFRNGLPKPSQHLLPWNQSISPSSHCQWLGVACHSDGSFDVESLKLSDLGLSGILEVSISNLCHLPSLLYLDLSDNNFTGSIPGILGNCSQLNTILLNGNDFSGSIPPELFKSKELLQLDLGYNQLSGTIPREVGHCKTLEYLGLYNNLLTGEIPEELFALPYLKFLYLSTNNLTGALPIFSPSCSLSDLRIHENFISGSLPLTLGNCRNLTRLSASSNYLSGRIPSEIFKVLLQFEFIYLDVNNFEGEIPETLWGLGRLHELAISGNKFNGSISEKIGYCHLLTYIDLSDNNFTGQIPRSIGNLKYLNALFMYNNMFKGELPRELGNCNSLIEIRLQDNMISGTIPPEICKLRSLKILHVFYNQIEGHIPQCIGKMSSLEELALYNNSLTGEIPSGIINLTNLTWVSLAHNNLIGEVPSDLGKNNVPGLVTLDLTGNHLYGRIPSSICAGHTLQVLTLGYNRFTGNLPTDILICKSLRRLILRNNFLQGSIPAENSSISYFDVRENFLEGRIPAVIGLWTNLSMIDLSKNKFSGSIPPELGALQNLEILKISSNQLTGAIPLQLSRCPKLTKLDLSKNNLTGSIPLEILSSLTLKSIFLQRNELSGIIDDSFSSSQNLIELQLGNNMLEGPIPCSLGRLHHFSRTLNLSMNRLSGEIPKCLSKLDKLEILDISSNNLSGEIPSDLNNMRSLRFVNISYNDLSGQLPVVWEKLLDSHPGSFLRNPGLCLSGTEASHCGNGRRSHSSRRTLVIVMGAVVLSLVSLVAAIYILVIHIRRPFLPDESLLWEWNSRSEDLPEDLNFEDILRATEGWSEKYVIGRGKHGTVYRTESVKSKKQWAVKKVNLSETRFSNEMRTLSLIRHRNVVRMGGYSIRNGYGFVVMEFMSGGTLYDVLHRSKPRVVLNWESRYRIALGIAQGLSYLHHDCVPQIIHRDIKSDNILLDSELEPKIADFGTAAVVSDSNESSTMSTVVGTLGYIAPENAYSIRLTEKCDVYSYGVILLELLCRKLPVDPSFEEGLDIVSWVRKFLQEKENFFGCLDEEISFWDIEEQRRALGLMDLALQCTEQEANIRLSMRDIVASLIKLDYKREAIVQNSHNPSF